MLPMPKCSRRDKTKERVNKSAMSQSTSAESNGKQLVQGITGISVSGYKSLYEECSIEVRPLTILAGANSSGKSSIMQPLLLMKQTLEATYDPGALLLYGPNVRFTSVQQFLSTISNKNVVDSFSVTIEIQKTFSVKNTFQRQPKKGINLIAMDYIDFVFTNENTNLIPEMRQEEIISALPEWLVHNYQITTRQQAEIGKIQGIEYEYKADTLHWVIRRNRCFLEVAITVNERLMQTYSPGFYCVPDIVSLIHIPGLRVNPERNYKITATGHNFPGIFEDYIASVINQWQESRDERLRDLGKALEALGLTWKVEARQLNDIQIELLVGRMPRSGEGKDMVSIADVGIGVSQALPVLVALLVAKAGQLVYLEQPEIHLHPRAQVGLAEVLANAANRGVRVVLETHSELLLLAVQSLVAEGKLSPDKVKLHWFTRGEDGVTKVSSAELDEAGAFGDWPEDFGDVSMKLESRYLDAAEARLWNRSHGS